MIKTSVWSKGRRTEIEEIEGIRTVETVGLLEGFPYEEVVKELHTRQREIVSRSTDR